MEFNPADWDSILKLMDRHEEFDTILLGRNEDDEFTTLSIFADKVVYQTVQNNGYIRVNTYWRDGTIEESYHKNND